MFFRVLINVRDGIRHDAVYAVAQDGAVLSACKKKETDIVSDNTMSEGVSATKIERGRSTERTVGETKFEKKRQRWT